ncbi:tetratricopeptide repeat protein [Tumebacillus sp. ITR2]|uniref:Tetratricopeptide repeat protein n=1 Tax=Tumebacillus amylolyticus TaxID=2801339 RepID=A0ABS1J7P1_9BACL|nr:helix-turn-helix domain-containing protein [Tumebacillus amylolyticus]MBL0386291.1 tetratricopeptide repeat protein [Tumebacillus amylolyticus]
MSLGQKIRELRVAKGLTQSDLGSGLVTPSMISQIESDKANPSYKVLEAIAEKLETPLEHFLADIQTQLEQTSAHKVAKALLSSRNYERATGLLESLLEKPSPNLNLIDVKTDLGDCYMNLNQYEQAIVEFEEVLEIAKEKFNYPALLAALNKLGVIEQKRQKYHRAIYHWRKAFELFDELPHSEPYLQSQILTNLGTIHYQLGEFKDALSYYDTAYKFLSKSNHFEQIGFTYLGLGLSYKKIQEFEKAAEYSQYAIAIFESLKNMKLAIDVKRNYGILKCEEGRTEEAMNLFNNCLEEYARHNYFTEAATVYGEIARLHLKERQFDLCREACQQALESLVADSRETAPILRTLAIAEEECGNLELAVLNMERARDLFAHHHLLNELAETYSLLGDLYQKQGDFQRANVCLQEMKKALTDNLKERGIIL